MIAGIGRAADLAVAPDHRHAVRRAGAEKQHTHEMNASMRSPRGPHRLTHHVRTPKLTRRPARLPARATRAGRRSRARANDGHAAIATWCPWDREQTHETLRPFLSRRPTRRSTRSTAGTSTRSAANSATCCSNASSTPQLAAETRRFDIADAVRHHRQADSPSSARVHAGGPAPAAAARGAEAATPAPCWNSGSAQGPRAGERGRAKRVLAGMPRSLPALLRAHEIGTRVRSGRFRLAGRGGVVDKIEEECASSGGADQGPARAAEEFGDVLFSLANLARKLGIEPESALRAANDKFTARFDACRGRLDAGGPSVHDASPDRPRGRLGRAKTRQADARDRHVRPPRPHLRQPAVGLDDDRPVVDRCGRFDRRPAQPPMTSGAGWPKGCRGRR